MAIMSKFTFFKGVVAFLLLLLFPLMVQGSAAPAPGETGIASYYHERFQGRKTASGERFDQGAYSAAHKTLPFGTTVRVTRLDNGKSVVVTINDRGPFKKGRIVDLSRQAARELGMIERGLVRVKVEVIRPAGQRA
jgi:rare lipoprotein A